MSIRQKTSVNDTSEDGNGNLELDLNGSVLGEFIKYRLTHNRDVKIIITAKSAGTGLGKTTLALLIAKWINQEFRPNNEWAAKEYAFVDVEHYINKYLEVPPKTALLLDEIEAGADKRRAMSGENVRLSKAWATLRQRNVVTISTLPTTAMLDDRMEMLADIWIHVVNRGFALGYFFWHNDYTGEIRHVGMRNPHNGRREVIMWDKLKNSDDFEYISDLKDTDIFGDGSNMYTEEEVDKQIKEAEKQKRNEMINTLYDETSLSQADIGNLFGFTQQYVSQIIN